MHGPEPDQSREHSRLLNEFVQKQERYKSLLPRPIPVLAGAREPEPPQPDPAYVQKVQQADSERLQAREALYRFRANHGMQ